MKKSILFKISAIVSGLSGLVILAGILIPIAGYETFANSKYPTLLSPLVEDKIQAGYSKLDDTKVSNWFPGASIENVGSKTVNFFTISVPKLKIANATVAVGGEDLSNTLVQYPGTALPGKIGDSVIFGHSILPIFYNPNNYMAIFSTIHTLKNGDAIFVDFDGISYKYEVESMKEVIPTDLSVLEQDKSGSYITLVTCTPPGDPRMPKRLAVRAKLVPFNEAYANTGN